MGCNDSREMKNNIHGSRTQPNYDNYSSPRNNSNINPSGRNNPYNDLKKKSNLKIFYEDLQNMYTQCRGDIKKFIRTIQQRVSQIYMLISQQTLRGLNHQQIATQQSKLIISQEILSLNLNILRVVGRNNNFNYDIDTFKQLNKFQKNLVGYLKTKYPRGTQNFVPGDLMNVFKEFDRTFDLEYDILKNSNTYFGQTNDDDLSRNIKIFFNKIINQLDSKFPIFQKLIQQKAFSIKNQKGDKVSLNYKIGRKISQYVPQYQNLDSGTIEINSPQIFRVLIKWMQDLEQTILHPYQKINRKQNFKCFKGFKPDGKIDFDYINIHEYNYLINQLLMQKIQSLGPQLQKKNELLLVQLDECNQSLIRLLNQANLKQKYVPFQEMEIIKYSNFNAKFISYILAEKILFAIKKLIEIGKSFKTQTMMDMDLIKFRVTDLMRCMVSGNKKQILQIYNNFKNLQSQGLIQILKIKNRFQTPMNDAMIIFMIKQSFLICQAQLILSEAGDKIDKRGKNIEQINHYFYQLQRSPYGILAQIAVHLAYKDSKISYQDKITFFQKQINFQVCKNKHPKSFVQMNEQKKPFICTGCSCFYSKFQNLFTLYQCKQCRYFLCGKCIINKNTSIQKQFVFKNIQKQLEQKIKIQNEQKSKSITLRPTLLGELDKNATPKDVLSIFNIQKQKISDLFGKNKKKIQAQKLMDHLDSTHQNQYNKFRILFVVANFTKGDATFKVYRYQPKHQQIQNTADMKQRYESKSNFYYTDYDILLTLKSPFQLCEDKNIKQKHSFVFLSRKQLQNKILQINKGKKQGKIKNQEQYQIISQKTFNQGLIVLDYYKVKKSTKEGQQAQQNKYQQDSNQKRVFKYPSLHIFVQKLPDINSAKSLLEFDDLGIQNQHLSFFKQINWQKSIKQLKLNSNNLTNISIACEYCQNLQRLYVNSNLIEQLNFIKPLPNLIIFNASQNKINKISGLRNINKLKKLLLEKNQFKNFPTCSQLSQLAVLNLRYNYITDISSIIDSTLPQLQQLIIDGQQYYGDGNQQQNQQKKGFFKFLNLKKSNEVLALKFPKLKSFQCQQNYILVKDKQIVVYSQNLQKIQFNECQIKKLTFVSDKTIQNMKYLRLTGNNIEDFNFLDPKQKKHRSIKDSFSSGNTKIEKLGYDRIYTSNSLIQLNLRFNKIQYIPVLKFFSLKILDLSFNQLKEIRALTKSKLPQLQSLQLTDNQIQEVVPLFLPKLKYLDFSSNINISSLNQLFKNTCQLSSLSTLKANYCQNIDFKFNVDQKSIFLPNLKILELQNNNFKEQQRNKHQFCIQNLEQLNLTACTFISFPLLKLPQLKKLVLSYSKAQSFKDLQRCKLNSLQNLQLIYMKQGIHFDQDPNLNQNNLNSNVNSTIGSRQKNTNLTQNHHFTCKLNFPNLKKLILNQSQIESIMGLQDSNLNKLQILSTYKIKTKYKKYPKIKAPNLLEINAQQSGIQNLDYIINQSLGKLQVVNFRNNKICGISDTNISYLKNIKQIDLSHNQIKKFICSQKLDYLTSLDISCNKLSGYPRIKAKQLVELNLNGNRFTDVTELQNCDIPKISQINLADSDLSKSNLPRLNMPGLQKLTLSNCKLKNIENLSKSYLPSLSLLDLYDNQLAQTPRLNLESLKDLRLGNNKLVSTKELQKSNFPILSILVLNQNPLSKFPQSFNFLNLKKLWFNKLPIRQIPELQLPYIQLLQFQQLELQNIDNFAKGQYPQLAQFSLRSNKIKKLPLFYMPNLKSAFFLQNQIDDITQFCNSYLPNLDMLSIANNKIEYMPDISFLNLRQLFMNNNQIRQLSCFKMNQYPKLQIINACYNKISHVRKFPRMPKLDELWLTCSRLTQIQWLIDSALNLPNLRIFSVQLSRVRKVPYNIDAFPKLSQLLLLRNPISDYRSLLSSQVYPSIIKATLSLDLQQSQYQKVCNQVRQKNPTAAIFKYDPSAQKIDPLRQTSEQDYNYN